MSKGNKWLITILGPTAVGKTAMAIEMAMAWKTHIISADSRQFFKELTIGTAKPSPVELRMVPHHFVDFLSIEADYNVNDFEKDALARIDSLFEDHDVIILTGGSGLYLNAITEGFDEGLPDADEEIRTRLKRDLETKGITSLQEELKKLDPVLYSTIDLNNAHRLYRAIEACLVLGKPFSSVRKGQVIARPFNVLKIGLNMQREDLYERINLRVDRMMESGLLSEVKSVLAFREKNALKTVGYRELFSYLDGDCTLEEAVEKVKVNSRRYAKRQLTWFRKDPDILWFHPDQKEALSEAIKSQINS